MLNYSRAELALTTPGTVVPGTGHIVGTTYLCNYWRKTYKVLAGSEDGLVKVHWLEDDRVATHRTALDPKDKVLEAATS